MKVESSDRREYPRRPYDLEVLCYIDGSRLDRRTADISIGGVFLKTHRYDNFPKGAMVAIVFEDSGIPPGTAFLFARVMRHQESPVPGVGLEWDRAVCGGSPEPLRRVLKRLFGIESAVFVQREVPERGLTQYVFRFDAHAASKASTVLELDRPEPANMARGPVSSHVGSSSVAEGPAIDPGSASSGTGRPSGPLSRQIDIRSTRQAVDFPAFLEAVGVPIAVRLRWIGSSSAGVDCPWVPMDPDMPMLLKFDLPTREGAVTLNCNVRMRASDMGKGGRLPAVDLVIKDIDEAGHPGLLVRYLKWLACKQMSND